MRNDFCSGYLMHHGIQGQKWGVRNGPPYPLDSKAKSSSEKKIDKSKGLAKKQKTYIAIGAAAAATTLAIYGTYKLGGPKGVAKTTKELAKHITSGKKASKPYMNLNLQYFAKKPKKKKSGFYRFKSEEEYARVMHVFDSVQGKLKEEPYLVRRIQSNDGPGGGAYYYYATNMDGHGDFRVTKRKKISKSGTGLLERGKYV